MMGFDLTVVGASLGGLRALEALLKALPSYFPLPIAIAQHRHRLSDGELVAFLQRHSNSQICEAEDKQAIESGRIYLAPADYHLLVEPGHFALSTEAPVNHARPSIDVLFESAADAYADRVIGIVLTGASHDGAQGLAKIHAHGGHTIVQDPATAESRTMPDAALTHVPRAQVMSLAAIVPHLVELCSPLIHSPPDSNSLDRRDRDGSGHSHPFPTRRARREK